MHSLKGLNSFSTKWEVGQELVLRSCVEQFIEPFKFDDTVTTYMKKQHFYQLSTYFQHIKIINLYMELVYHKKTKKYELGNMIENVS